MQWQVQTFKTRAQALERIEQIQSSVIRPAKEYDPKDPNADETGHVWIISMVRQPDGDKFYLCTDGCVR